MRKKDTFNYQSISQTFFLKLSILWGKIDLINFSSTLKLLKVLTF